MSEWVSMAGTVLAVGVAAVLTLSGLLLSVLSISGTWFVLAAAVLLGIGSARPFPGLMTVLAFAAVCLAVEGAEGLAGYWGVKARGGSRWAAVAALAGGLAGLVLGAALPVPLFGPLIGMVVLSFVAAFAVEQHRMRSAGHAASVAWGAVLARVAVVLLKSAATLAMAAVLWAGFVFAD